MYKKQITQKPLFIMDIVFEMGKLYVPADTLDNILKKLEKEMAFPEREKYVKQITIMRATKKQRKIVDALNSLMEAMKEKD